MDSRHSFSLLSVSGGGRTGRLHIMQDVSEKALCGRSTDGAIVHEDAEWAVELLSMNDLTKATSVCARCRNAYAKLRDTVKNPVQ